MSNKSIPLLSADTLRRKAENLNWPIPIVILVANLTSTNPELAAAAKRKIFSEITSAPDSIPTVSVPKTATNNSPANNRKQQYLFCFQFNRTRNLIELGTGYQSTVDYRQRLGFPFTYLWATDLEQATIKASVVNDILRSTDLEFGDCEYAVIEQLEPALHTINGFLHVDETDNGNPLPTPPLKNVQAIKRKRSKKSVQQHTQLAAVINHETTKRLKPFATTELERCKREHKPITYVAPPAVTSIPPDVSGIRLSKLARDIAAAAASELGMPPLPTELQLIEQQEQAVKEKQNREWLKVNKLRRKKAT